MKAASLKGNLMYRNRRGFTLVELVIVIAMLAILSAIAIPTYISYSARARVAEGIEGIAWAKKAVAETIRPNGREPARNLLGKTEKVQTPYIDSIAIADDGSGAITVITHNTGASREPVLTFTPELAPGQPITWNCSLERGDPIMVPSECRN